LKRPKTDLKAFSAIPPEAVVFNGSDEPAFIEPKLLLTYALRITPIVLLLLSSKEVPTKTLP